MATSTPERQRVTLTIPADIMDDFRVGLLADLKSDAEGFAVEHANLLDAKPERKGNTRIDRDGRIAGIRETSELLLQLPDHDIEATVSGTAGAFRWVLEDAGRLLVERLRREFDYAPVPIEDVPPLLDRLHWVTEQIAALEVAA